MQKTPVNSYHNINRLDVDEKITTTLITRQKSYNNNHGRL